MNVAIFTMSEMGQTEKNSVRANVFRVTPESGHCSIPSACLKGAISRRPTFLGARPFHPDTVAKAENRTTLKNLAKGDLWTSLLLRSLSSPLRTSVIDFGWKRYGPRVDAPKMHQRSLRRYPLKNAPRCNLGGLTS